MDLITDLDTIRTDDGKLPAYAWPGGCPMYYVVADNGILCPECANEPESQDTDADCPDDDQWRIVAYGVNWEDDSMYCDNCNERIEPAYGD